MATTSNSVPQGNNIGVEQYSLSFEVLDLKARGRNEENGKERYWIKVKFADGKETAFRTESKSLKTAFEMIEVIGQQTQRFNPGEFQTYVNSNRNKRIWFNMTNISQNPNFKQDQVTAYKSNRHANSLKHAFSEHKNRHFRSTIEIGNTVLDELKRLAKLHRTQLADAANLHPHDLRIDVRRDYPPDD